MVYMHVVMLCMYTCTPWTKPSCSGLVWVLPQLVWSFPCHFSKSAGSTGLKKHVSDISMTWFRHLYPLQYIQHSLITDTTWGCDGVRIRIQIGMLSDSVNILLIEIRSIFRLIRIRIQLSFWKAMFHRSLQSAATHKKVKRYTLNTYLLTSVQITHRIGRELLVQFGV